MLDKHVLICYTSIGSGHRSAAQAVQMALHHRGHDLVELLDVFDEGKRKNGLQEALTTLSTRFFPGIYNWSWRTGSLIWAFKLSSQMPFVRGRVLSRCRKFSPDLVICTHALPAAVLAQLSDQARPRVMAVATDFQVHPYWPLRQIDAFVVPSPLAVETLLLRGFPQEKIFQLGIPTLPLVISGGNRRDGKLRILVIAGSRQIGPYRAVRPRVQELLHLLGNLPVKGVSWRFIFGADERLMEEARQYGSDSTDITLFGLVDDMPRHYQWADLVAVKPGGLALAESFAHCKPVLLLSQGVGQERANAGVVLASGAGVLTESPAAWMGIIESIKHQPDFLERLQLGARALGRPDSAVQAAQLAETLMQ